MNLPYLIQRDEIGMRYHILSDEIGFWESPLGKGALAEYRIPTADYLSS